LIIEADSKAEAARIARRQELGRKHLLEEGEFIVICCTNGTRELKGSAK
jgi:hypothetical protein